MELNNKQNLQALEFKWKDQKNKIPAAFAKACPEAEFETIHKENYLEWIQG